MGLVTDSNNIGIYKDCIKDTNSLKNLTLSLLFNRSNRLDLGPTPGFLPILTAVEELLITRVYVYLQVVYIRGQQHRYTSHVCCFGQNTPKTQRQLLRLPSRLNILVVRPAAVEGGEYLSQRFTKWYTIRRFTIIQQLYFLKVNYSNYRDIKIYSTWLTSLPENSFILDQLPYINESESNFSSLIVYLITFMQPPAFNPLPAKLSSNILDSKFDNNILDTLVPDLIPNFNKLKFLGREV